MKVTIPFNIGMTFALVGFGLLLAPAQPDHSSTLLIEWMFPGKVALQVLVCILSLAGAVAASMYIIRALWNRLFPNLCGWKEINLAESYALSLLIGMFFF